LNLTTSFEKFDTFADAPDAVAKIRELAVKGGISSPVPSDSGNRTWSEFVAELDQRIIDCPADRFQPFEIPDHWRWALLEDVAEACGQKMPDAKFSYVDVGSIDNVKGVIKTLLEILDSTNAPSRARKLVCKGAVIFATVRPYLKNIAIVDREISPPTIVITAFAVLNPKPFLDPRFLFYWLRSRSFEREVASRMKGVAYPAISDGDFWDCWIPIPPLAEQRRIVAKVDQLMALVDELETQLAASRATAKNLLQALVAELTAA
jgi:type I restriction enzyme S subunit